MTTACLAPNGMNVYRSNAPSTRLLVGTAGGIAVLERSPGKDWTSAGLALVGPHISSMCIEPVRGGVYAGVHNGVVFRSGDQGRTWEEMYTALRIPHVYSVNCTVENGEPVIYAGTEPVAMFRTRDEGRSWQELAALRNVPGKEKWMFPMPPHVAHLKCIAIDPRDPKVIYAGVEQGGLFKTTDGGETWRELDGWSRAEDEAYKDCHQLVMRPNHPDEIYLTTGPGSYRSLDGGATWARMTVSSAFRIGYPNQIIFSPEDDRTMYMCGASGNPGTWVRRHTAEPTIMVSHDLGESWQPASSGLPEPMVANLEAMSMYVRPGGFELFAGTTDGKVYFSDDKGQSWRAIGDKLAPVSKVAHFRLLLPGAISSRSLTPGVH